MTSFMEFMYSFLSGGTESRETSGDGWIMDEWLLTFMEEEEEEQEEEEEEDKKEGMKIEKKMKGKRKN